MLDSHEDLQPTADFYLLGEVDFDRALGLQRRLAYQAGESADSRLAILLCEHGDLITVGRSGSRGHIRRTNEQLQRQAIRVEWVARGGGCIPHSRGQLAVYPIVPLAIVGWTIGEYMRRLQRGFRQAIEQLKIHTYVRDERFGIWGQNGLIAATGVAVQNWVTYHGAFINVSPPMTLYHFVDTAAGADCLDGKGSMTSLLAERRGAVKMANVRTSMIESLAAAFGCDDYHVHASHPWLRKAVQRNSR